MKRVLVLGLVFLAACASSVSSPDVDEVFLHTADTPGLPLLSTSDTLASQPPTPRQSTLASTPTQRLMDETPTEILYGCAVVQKLPADGTPFEPGMDVLIQFRLKNTGVRTWVSGLRLSYLAGGGIVTNAFHSLPEVAPGEDAGPFEFIVRAPLENGTYSLRFQLGNFCFPYVRVVVER